MMIQTTTPFQNQNWTLPHPLLTPAHPLPAQTPRARQVPVRHHPTQSDCEDEAFPTLHLPDSQHMATIPLEHTSK